MEISVTQASNGFIQSVRINRMILPSDAQDHSHGGAFGDSAPPNFFFSPQIFLFPEKFVLKI